MKRPTPSRDDRPARGIPTRTGRVLICCFAAPFVGFGLFMLGWGMSGTTRPGEWLPLLLGGTVFLVVGLVLLAPAFPGVADSLRHADSPAVRRLGRRLPRLAIGTVTAIMFFTPMLIATGVIPTDDADWPVPRWVGGVAASVFLVGGLFVLFHQRIQGLPPENRKRIMGLFPMLIVTGMAVIADWIAFGPGERRFSVSLGSGLLGLSWLDGDWLGRVLFGLSGLFLTGVALIAWWKYLRDSG